MKKEYDFSDAKQGKFYRPIEELEIPIYLNKKIKNFYLNISQDKKAELIKIINNV